MSYYENKQNSAPFDPIRRAISFIRAKELLPNFVEIWQEFLCYMGNIDVIQYDFERLKIGH